MTYDELRLIFNHARNGAVTDARAAIARLTPTDRRALASLTGKVARLAAEVGDRPTPPAHPCREALMAALAELERRP